MRWMPRLRIGLARHPWVYWLVVTLLVAVVAVAADGLLADVRRERDAWGERRTVVVADVPIAPGESIGPLTSSRSVPLVMVPAGASSSVAPSDTARQHIGVGEIVVEVDIGELPGPLAVLPDGWLALTIEIPVSAATTFRTGDDAVVLAAGETIAADAVVVEVLAGVIVVGVPAADGAVVAEMSAQRLAVVALVG